MTPQQLVDFRIRMGWNQSELARRLELSQSRISDYEKGHTRSQPPRPAPIPKLVELACRWLEEHARPLTAREKSALLRDTRHLPHSENPPVDVSRAAIYGEPPRGL